MNLDDLLHISPTTKEIESAIRREVAELSDSEVARENLVQLKMSNAIGRISLKHHNRTANNIAFMFWVMITGMVASVLSFFSSF